MTPRSLQNCPRASLREPICSPCKTAAPGFSESSPRLWASKARKACKAQPDLPEHLAFPEHPALQERLEPLVQPDQQALPEYPVLPVLLVQPVQLVQLERQAPSAR